MDRQDNPSRPDDIGSVSIHIGADGMQRIAVSGQVGPADLAIASFYLMRTANQMADATQMAAQNGPRPLEIAQTLPADIKPVRPV